ncbi:hypothetical protein SAMN03084138_04417 [Enterovibrio norvegicus DSM 15893]|uniref:Uncharacterized protein n=1 Tax=Enterovibrio norvegicus DSM 15893 TaxID=1121869 RepID=A0A1I5WT04_9GAMM|nr:hypothetical protein SAMN03084138_04417 [Enterovibrio norvegicus DSM 15893]
MFNVLKDIGELAIGKTYTRCSLTMNTLKGEALYILLTVASSNRSQKRGKSPKKSGPIRSPFFLGLSLRLESALNQSQSQARISS